MTTDDEDRRADLIAGSLAGDLTPAEENELAALRAADPTIDVELAEGAALTQRLGDLGEWQESGSAPALAGIPDEPAPVVVLATWRRASVILAAAACVTVGAAAAVLVQGALNLPPSGPAGTLGAVEEVTFSAGAGGDAIVSGAVIAHTWGTETSLQLSGLEAGETYTVVLVGTDGEEFAAGTILGTTEKVTCVMNAAILRQDVGEVEVRTADDALLAEAPLGPVAD